MVGHTGVWQAAIEACEVVDACVSQVVEHALKSNYITFLVSDHGNVEQMLQEDGSPYTAHTTNPVPFVRIDPDYQHPIKTGTLIDVAPTILQAMHIPIPAEMKGRPL
jgi:2,3-bisphosphoglycerate-independent phosphoglycerate mutase